MRQITKEEYNNACKLIANYLAQDIEKGKEVLRIGDPIVPADRKLIKCNFSVRLLNSFRSAFDNMHTVRDLYTVYKTNPESILRAGNIGRKSLLEIEMFFKEHTIIGL